MADYRESSGFCQTCQRQVVVRKERTNDVFWLLAVLFSCGLFVIFWIISSLNKASQPYHCSVCGTPLLTMPAHSGKPSLAGSISNGRKAWIFVAVFLAVTAIASVLAVMTDTKPASKLDSERMATTSVSPSQPQKVAPQTSSISFHAGYKKGLAEGQSWRSHPGQELPEDFAINIMVENVASANNKGDDNDWITGWVEGFKKAFATRPSPVKRIINADDDSDFESLSWANAKVGTKLYTRNESEAATITSFDIDSSMISIRYKNGTVEPYSVHEVSEVWFVKTK